MTEIRGDGRSELTANQVIGRLEQITRASEIHGQLTDSRLAYKVNSPYWWHNLENTRHFFLGNEHDNIHSFFKVVDSLNPPVKPMTIVNFDEHIDDSPYTKDAIVNGSGLNAAWQRHAVDTERTDRRHSYNVMPDRSVFPDSEYTQEMSMEQFEAQLAQLTKIDVLSVDLDFFNSLEPGSKRWTRAVNILKACAKKSSAVMLFTSPVFSKHDQGINLSKILFEELSK